MDDLRQMYGNDIAEEQQRQMGVFRRDPRCGEIAAPPERTLCIAHRRAHCFREFQGKKDAYDARRERCSAICIWYFGWSLILHILIIAFTRVYTSNQWTGEIKIRACRGGSRHSAPHR